MPKKFFGRSCLKVNSGFRKLFCVFELTEPNKKNQTAMKQNTNYSERAYYLLLFIIFAKIISTDETKFATFLERFEKNGRADIGQKSIIFCLGSKI